MYIQNPYRFGEATNTLFDIELSQEQINHIFAKNSDGLALTE